jgi:hypothetical protein
VTEEGSQFPKGAIVDTRPGEIQEMASQVDIDADVINQKWQRDFERQANATFTVGGELCNREDER